MKTILSTVLFLLSGFIFSQSLPYRVYEQNDNIYIVYSNKSKVIPKGGMEAHSNPSLSPNKKLITFLIIDLEIGTSTIGIYNLSTNKISYLVKSSYDCKTGGTPISYKNTKKYPFPTLCEINKVIFNSSSTKLFFSSKAWKVSNAVHVYDIETKKISFLCAGSLINAKSNGNLIVDTTGVDDNGRWTQNIEINVNGQIVSTIGEKSY